MAETPPVKYRITTVLSIIIFTLTGVDDGLKLLLALIPGIDIADFFFWFLGWVPLQLLFLMRLGLGYLKGKKAGSKITITLATTMIGLIPVLDGLVPELTLEALGIVYATRAEDRMDALAKAEEAAKKAANDDRKRVKLPRTA